MSQLKNRGYRVIDAHAHIFPEKIAAKASDAIGDFYGISMHHTGLLDELTGFGAQCGIEGFLVSSTATVTHQVPSINNFIHMSCAGNPHLVGFGSLHPDYADNARELDRMAEIGLRGVKLHPDFQKFAIDDPNFYPIYDCIRAHGLPILMHMGDDRYDYSHPRRLAKMLADFPGLVVIAAHFGGYQSWDEVPHYLLELPDLYFDTSSSLAFISRERARGLIDLIGEDRFFFGTDYPMWSPGEELDRFFDLGLTDAQNRKILFDNFARLFHID